MNCYGAKELAASFRTVRKNTIKIAEEIDEQHYGFSATPATQSVAQLLSHIALGTRMPHQIHGAGRLSTLEGFDFMGFFGKLMAEQNAPRTKEQLIALLRDEGERYAQWLETLPDALLAEPMVMPAGITPSTKSRFEMLLGVKEHEMHHRAQLMLMQRMVGLVPHLTREMEARIAAMQANKATA